MMNRTWVEVNIDNVLFNLNNIRSLLNQETGILAAVKANAYGHDSIEISLALQDNIEMFGVASIDEAIELRDNDVKKPIMILSPVIDSDIERVIRYNCIPNVHSLPFARKLDKASRQAGVKSIVHIEVDTGMNRTGIDFRHAADRIANIAQMDNIRIDGIFSHFAEAEKLGGFTIEQTERFDIIINELKNRGILYNYLHLSNSAGIVNAPEAQYNMVRPGIMLYGQYTSPQLRDKIDLKPAMTMKSRICQIKTLRKGDTVSYTRAFTAPREMTAATVLVGYADGYSRLLSNKAHMFVKGRRCPVIGKVCMDLTLIDISGLKNSDVKVGDEVEIFGNNINIDELADITSMINYELMTGVGPRVPRIFIRDNKIYKTKNIMAHANRGLNGR